MPKRYLLLAAGLGWLAASGPIAAQQPASPPQKQTDHSGHKMPMPSSAGSPSTKAFEAANAKMHTDMAIKFTGNADADFIAGMIPHHEGAVAMAKVVLAHGKDVKVRKLAQDIIKAQNTEIAWMKGWLAKNAKAASAAMPK
jgi:uncharacterized protein (DUF305 family)